MKYCHLEKFDLNKLHPLNIYSLAANVIPENVKILEIGGADGFFSEYLAKEKKGEVFIIEKDEEAVSQAKKKGLQAVAGDIEDKAVLKKITTLGKFDIILSLALIEHLVDPLEALKSWQPLLKEEGKLVISTSNIAHWTARLKILEGKFAYEKYGIFDESHLHFFTIDSFKKLLKEAGFKEKIFLIDPVGGGWPKISRFLSRFFPGLFAYQMLIVAEKGDLR